MSLISSQDFTGIYAVGKNILTSTEIEQFIALKEDAYCSMLFGAEFWDEIKATITGDDSSEPLYDVLIKPFNKDVRCDVLNSTGLKNMLIGLIYFDFIAHSSTRPNFAGGLSAKKAENSEVSVFPQIQAHDKWNESVMTSRSIQAYIRANRKDYPLFKGKEITFSTAFN
jgi:hypothetical protein